MKYIVCEKPGELVVKDKAAPELKQGHAKLKIKKVGVCGTDLHAFAGNQAFFTYPRILGHELAAEVLEISDDASSIQVGDKVVIVPYLSCGKCIACRNGKTNCCVNMQVLGVHTDGGMQETIVVPTSILIPSPELSLEQMAIVEPLAIGQHAIRRAAIQNGETIVVIGCGPIGIGIMKLAQIAGANVIAVDVNERRLDYVKDQIGITMTVDAKSDPAAQIKAFTNDELATAVFDATGHKGALEDGVNYMSHGGRYVLVGLSKGDLTFNHPAIHAKETTLMCSRNATLEDFHKVIEVLGQGKFPTSSFITHQLSFTEVPANFEGLINPENGVIKAMINF